MISNHFLFSFKIPKSAKAKCILGSALLGAGAYSLWPRPIYCQELPPDYEASSRLVHKPVLCSEETKFDWSKLWALLKPDRLWLLAAISVSKHNTYRFTMKNFVAH